MFGLVDRYYDEVKGVWEERYEHAYGLWRGFVDDVIHAFMACGDFQGGFARVLCDACQSEYLLAFSCSRRGFCPSCAAKRAAIFGALLRDEILEDVPHAMWTFSIPKMLRRYFLYDRKLLGELSRVAWETVRKLQAEAVQVEGLHSGMVCAVQTANDDLTWSPHIHGIASRGGWDALGRWVAVPFVDSTAAEKLFRYKVLSLLKKKELLTEERIEILDTWRHSVPRRAVLRS